jgi:hypothetical protein
VCLVNMSSVHVLSDTVFASELAVLLSHVCVQLGICKLHRVQRKPHTIMPS